MSDTRTVLRLNRVRSDGSANRDLIAVVVKDPVTGEEMREADGTPAVVIYLRPMEEEERRAIIAEHTVLEKDPQGGRGIFERVDTKAVTDEVLRRAIDHWEGIAGSDDRPLICTDQTKILLDPFLQAQITRKLFNAEAVEVLTASFR